MSLTLTGPQERMFSEVLRKAFPDPDRLDAVLQFYLEIPRADLTLKTNYPARVFDILVDAKARNWTHKLLLAAREANPENPDLLAFAQQFGLASAIRLDNGPVAEKLNRAVLERKIKKANSQLDVVAWRTMLGRIEGQVCRVELPDGTGTGFLLGTNVVITNYHVVESVINGPIKPEDVILRFDYKKLDDGTTVNEGTTYRLAVERGEIRREAVAPHGASANWLIDRSPYSAVDLQDPPPSPPQPDQLDYALLRVDGAPANDPIGGAANLDPNAKPRGYVEIPTAPHNFLEFPALFIMQHPDGEPLTLAFDTEAVIDVNKNATRVRYRTNTEAGSSGSPCFDANWKLIALHHAGDPQWTPTYNQGIPFTAILKLLNDNGKIDALGAQQL